MHPRLQEYISRFPKPDSTQFDQFFTQFDLDEYIFKLPFLYEIEGFCLRLLVARLKQEQVCIYSDYDTDAVTATATMYWGLQDLGFEKENLNYYAPDRFTEGYGMNPEAVRMLSERYDLIVSVDCGINSVEEAEVIRQSKADLIITDHHHLKDEIPEAIAVLNPRIGEKFKQDQEIKESRGEQFSSHLTPLQEECKQLLSEEGYIRLETWLQDMKNSSKQSMSTSVTGVGVAWFCLVWFGYFLDTIKLD
jgi:hypothetical protein